MALSAPEPLSAAHDISRFNCGKPALDHWLRQRALSNQEKGFTVVMVVHDATRGRVLRPGPHIPGARRAAAVDQDRPAAEPAPCLLLGPLATDLEWAGHGVGTSLLSHALARCVQAATLIGGRALLINAIDPEAAAFWQQRGFLLSKDDPLTLFRSIADIAASLKAVGITPP